ncbi:MAG: hypothetical protein ACHRHE_06980 [Tepidisphaerales bacterium]
MSNQSTQNAQNPLALAANAAANQNGMLQVAGRVTNDDIVAIFIAKHEEAMHMKKLQAEQEMRNTNAAIKQIEEDMEAEGPRALKSVKFKDAALIAEKLNAGGFGKFEARVTLEGTKLDDKTWTIEIAVVKVAEKTDSYSSDTAVASKEIIVPFTREAVSLAGDLRAHQRELVNTQTELLDIKRQLSNIPSLMLRARARLAELALSKTEEGQQILAQLMGTTALPTSL